MTSISFRIPALAVGLVAALIFPASSAWAQDDTFCFKCNKSIQSGDLIEGCTYPDSSGPTTLTCVLNPEQQGTIYLNLEDGDPDNDLVCTRLFWTADGQYFPYDADDPAANRPHDVVVRDGSTVVANAWYHCRGVCNDPPCGGGVGVFAIDMDVAEWVTDPVVEAIDPFWTIGDCATGTPCATEPFEPVRSLTARLSVAGLEFKVWDDFELDRNTIEASTPAGLGSPQSALYAQPDPINYCTRLDALVGRNGCGPLLDLGQFELIAFQRGSGMSPIDQICQYVLGLEQCGCLNGFCPALEVFFDVSELDTIPHITVASALTGQVHAIAKKLDATTRIMHLPMDAELLEYGVLILDFGEGLEGARAGSLGAQVINME